MIQLFLERLSVQYMTDVFMRMARAVLILAAAFILVRIIRSLIPALRRRFVGVMERHAGGADPEFERRAATIGGIIGKTASVAVWITAIIMVLTEAGFSIGPILAGAGIVGLAVGFGAQNLVRDVISGLFMLVENQIRIGDAVVIDGTGGVVEEINLRTTVLRSQDGAVHVFPNGSIARLSNMSREYGCYVFDLGISYDADTDRAAAVLEETAAGMMRDENYRGAILEPLEVLGVDRFGDSAVFLKARIKTRPLEQWRVGREMNRRLKKNLEQAGIEIPYPGRNLYLRGGQGVLAEAADRERLRQVIREVLAEARSSPSRE